MHSFMVEDKCNSVKEHVKKEEQRNLKQKMTCIHVKLTNIESIHRLKDLILDFTNAQDNSLYDCWNIIKKESQNTHPIVTRGLKRISKTTLD